MSLEFEPLYWIYHDGWNFKESRILITYDAEGNARPIDKSKTFHHAGHIHLFCDGIDPVSNNQCKAYSGEQVYNFQITDEWGPNSKDPNQNKSYRLVGKPVWYFYVEEYWRRFYIQPWITDDKTFTNGLHDGKKGIKYDASKPQHSLGPFREGGELYFYNTVVNRTMPVEYWLEKTKHTRDLFIKKKSETDKDTTGGQTWTFDKEDEFFKWTYDTHFAPESWGWYGYRTHRLRNIHSGRYYDFQGTNAKRLKNDVDNDVVASDEIGWQQSSWSGWYEYKEITSYNGIWYRRTWCPYLYSKDNFSGSQTYSKQRRKAFPNPPPNLCKKDDDLTDDEKHQLRWEYFHYFDKVRYYSETGTYDQNADNWENRLEKYKTEKKLTTLTDAQEQSCFDLYLTELGTSFFQPYMDQERNGIFYVNDNSNPTYLTYSEFHTIWTPLTQKEINDLNLNGDYPTRNSTPLPASLDESVYSQHPESFEWTEDPIVNWKKYFDKREIFTIPHDTAVLGDYTITSESEHDPLHPRELSYSTEDGARWIYPDDRFVGPVLEYQKVVHLNWQRLPAKQSEESFFQNNWRTDPGDFGDDFSVSISIPFKKNDEVQSPFSGKDGITRPIGVYCHDVVKPEDKLRYHVIWCDTPVKLRNYYYNDYVSFINSFKALNPEYDEDTKDTDENLETLHSSEDWKDKFEAFWTAQDAIHGYSAKPITRDNTEYTFDPNTRTFKSPKTQNFITADKVAVIENADGTATSGYIDSTGSIRKGGKVVEFLNPYPDKTDGTWVEQCLGAIVKAKVVLVLEDALGYRWQETVDATQLTSQTKITGSDYGN